MKCFKRHDFGKVYLPDKWYQIENVSTKNLTNMATCQSWPSCQATISDRVGLHNCKSHNCFSCTLPFITKCPSKSFQVSTSKIWADPKWSLKIFDRKPFIVDTVPLVIINGKVKEKWWCHLQECMPTRSEMAAYHS